MLRQPPSLRKASIDNILCHLDDFWCAKSTKLLKQPGVVFTPFQYLCDDMIQEIIDMRNKRSQLLRPHHFKLLLHSNIRRLNLRVWRAFKNDQNCIIRLISIRCQKLTHLDLEEISKVKPEIMCTLMTNLSKIVCLKNVKTDTHVIKTICENCPNLLELDLKDFTSFHEPNLLFFCNYPGNPKPPPKLKKLSIRGRTSELTKYTVALVLRSQTSLKYLDVCGKHIIDHAFDQMYGEEFRSLKKVPSERIHNLLDITIDGSLEGDFNLGEADRLDLTFQCCPFLTKLTLTNLKEGESLSNVTKLKHLKTLSVSMIEKGNFSMHMASLLSQISDKLTDLYCSWFDEATRSIILISKSGPSLESLELRDVNTISEQPPIGGHVTHFFPYFPNLKYIIINHQGHGHLLGENLLSGLFQNASIFVHGKSILLNNSMYKVALDISGRVFLYLNVKYN